MAFECGRNGHGHAINWYRSMSRGCQHDLRSRPSAHETALLAAKRFEVESAARIVDDDLFAELAVCTIPYSSLDLRSSCCSQFQHKTATAVQDILAVGRFTCSRGSAYNFSRR